MPIKKKSKRSGYNTNLASEFYALATLYRLGFDANLTLGNKKSVDIVVVRAPGDVATVDVKAVAGKMDWLVGNVVGPPRDNHFIVLLSYEGAFEDVSVVPSAWILPHAELLSRVGTPKTKSSLRFLSRKRVREECKAWKDAWHLIGDTAAA